MSKTLLIALTVGVIAVIAALVVFLLSRDNSEDTSLDNNSSVAGSDSDEVNDDVDLTIEMSDFKYSQKLIEVARGETLRVELKTINGTHDFVVDEFNIDSGTINRGRSKIIEISIPEDARSGDYEFYCSVMDHRALGMVGTLRVK